MKDLSIKINYFDARISLREVDQKSEIRYPSQQKNKQKQKLLDAQNANTLSKTAKSKRFKKDMLAQRLLLHRHVHVKIDTTLSYLYCFCIAYLPTIILRKSKKIIHSQAKLQFVAMAGC